MPLRRNAGMWPVRGNPRAVVPRRVLTALVLALTVVTPLVLVTIDRPVAGAPAVERAPGLRGGALPDGMAGIDRRWLSDGRRHNLLDRPRDNPRRTALFFAFLSWVWIVFLAGATDRWYVSSFMSYEAQVWVFRAAAVLAPFVVYFVVRRICDELSSGGGHPLRGWTGRVVRRDPRGGYVTVSEDDGRRE